MGIVIKDIPIDKITPDPEQPRKYFDPEKIGDIAKTIKTEGIINPIEIDSNFVIVTGERRWRAAQMAGLKTVPCKIIEISQEHRLRRQIIENIHAGTMTDFETAEALVKLLGHEPGKDGKSWAGDVAHLAEEVGKSKSFIDEKFLLFTASSKMKSAFKKGLADSYLRALRTCPQEYKSILENKIVSNGFRTYKSAVLVAQALKTNPDDAEKILSEDYSGMDERAVIIALNKLAPRHTTPLTHDFVESNDTTAEFMKAVHKLNNLLSSNRPEVVGAHNFRLVGVALNNLTANINSWLQHVNQKELKDG